MYLQQANVDGHNIIREMKIKATCEISNFTPTGITKRLIILRFGGWCGDCQSYPVKMMQSLCKIVSCFYIKPHLWAHNLLLGEKYMRNKRIFLQ